MKVNIIGNGTIPMLGLTAPIRNIDLEETKIRALVNVKTLRIYNAESGILITSRNINGIFAPAVEEETVETVEVKEETPTPAAVEETVSPVEESAVVAVEETTDEEPEEINEEETVSKTAENVVNNNGGKKKNRKK